jgi:hypothetical protein
LEALGHIKEAERLFDGVIADTFNRKRTGKLLFAEARKFFRVDWKSSVQGPSFSPA